METTQHNTTQRSSNKSNFANFQSFLFILLVLFSFQATGQRSLIFTPVSQDIVPQGEEIITADSTMNSLIDLYDITVFEKNQPISQSKLLFVK